MSATASTGPIPTRRPSGSPCSAVEPAARRHDAVPTTSCASWLDSFAPLRRLPADVAAGSRVVELTAGSRIFGPGQRPENFLLVLDGVVRVSQVSEGGREIVLYRASPPANRAR
jgi:hypothetical protein